MATKLTELTPLQLKGSADKPSLIAAKPVITVREALKDMAKHNITSLPIYSHDSDNIVNIVNLIDVLNYIIKEAVADEKLPNTLDSEKSHNLGNPIEVVMTLDSEKESYRMFTTDANEPILTTLEAFSKSVHRSLVIDYTNKVPQYILTQTDIIRYVYAHPESLPGIDFNASLESFGLSGRDREIVIGRDNETALNVYRRMAERNLMGIPIINHTTNQLVGNLSVSDLRGLDYKSINHLVLPVLDFLATLPNADAILNPLTVKKDSTLREALKLISESHLHRLWIVNDEKKVIDVLTLSDLIGVFSKV
ncbi:2565_t:CDS:2 [Funneliformis geosporum]|uniref:16553_t:CDS:1 n=1 Tax=Funneliformis geosporum TaxID=1117311 RepID=A0A9W4WW96_9GLOM|nr:2565_t:CDS:2 [Funneliformis geosporum]CAI2176850.1 16553_t:CDS:2 [Funneliformis geosporum]